MTAARAPSSLCLLLLLAGCSDGSGPAAPEAWRPLEDGLLRDGSVPTRDLAPREAAPADRGGEAAADGGPALVLLSPEDGAALVVGRTVAITGRTRCQNATVELIADGKYPLGTLSSVTGDFSLSVTFNTEGAKRVLSATAVGSAGCSGAAQVTVAIQPAFAHTAQTLVDPSGCGFELHLLHVPLADPTLDIASVGAGAAKTVSSFGTSTTHAIGAINTGYFGFGFGPVSYAKGHLGYESQSGNVKGPRACLAYDRVKRRARVAISDGRQPLTGGLWGAGLFPNDGDVACAGPQLVQGGKNVALAHVQSENFASSGISPDSAYPRSAACVRADGSLLLAVAQSTTVKACGFDLPGLADALIARGCEDALNFDGGGSSALWFAGPPAVYHEGTEDRAVYQALLVLRP